MKTILGRSLTLTFALTSAISGTGCETSLVWNGFFSSNSTELLMTGDPTFAFGSIPVTSDSSKTITLTNASTGPLTGISTSSMGGSFDFLAGSYPGFGGTCGVNLMAGATCTIVLEFAPVASGNHSLSFQVSATNAFAELQTSTETLAGYGASLAVVGYSSGLPNFVFSPTIVGSSLTKVLTLQNTGDSTATGMNAAVTSPFAFTGGTYPGVGGTCGASLMGGATCTVEVVYAPTGATFTSQAMTISFNNGVSSTTESPLLEGQSSDPAILTISDSPTYAFGSVAVNAYLPKTFTITNVGGTTATIGTTAGLSAPVTFEGGGYPGSSGTCGSTLISGGACTITIVYNPVGPGAMMQTLSVNYFDGLSSTGESINLTGSATTPAFLVMSGGTNFATTAPSTPVDLSMTLTNTGTSSASSINTPARHTAINYKGGAYPGTGGNCGASIAGGASCTIVLTFNPPSPGPYNTMGLKIAYNDSVTVQNLETIFTGLATGALQATMLQANQNWTCAKMGNGVMKCWGDNSFGQLGLGDTNTRGDDPSEMGANLPGFRLSSLYEVSSFSMGGGHGCAILNNSKLKCWGRNDYGQLGLGDTNYRGDVPNEMGDNLPYVDTGSKIPLQVVTGGMHTCVRFSTGEVSCWGYNGEGQQGVGDIVQRGHMAMHMGANLQMINLGTGRYATQLAAGELHTCARLDNASVKCWGRNDAGVLGLGDLIARGANPGEMGDSLPAVALGIGRTAIQITTGAYSTCAQLDDQTVKCWGQNNYGALGQGNNLVLGDDPNEIYFALPIGFGIGKVLAAIAPGAHHMCARFTDNSTKCWGDNYYGQLGLGVVRTDYRGDNTFEMDDYLPTTNWGGGGFIIGLASGNNHSCGLLSSGIVKCFGHNAVGQLGMGHTTNWGDDAFPSMGVNLPTVPLD